MWIEIIWHIYLLHILSLIPCHMIAIDYKITWFSQHLSLRHWHWMLQILILRRFLHRWIRLILSTTAIMDVSFPCRVQSYILSVHLKERTSFLSLLLLLDLLFVIISKSLFEGCFLYVPVVHEIKVKAFSHESFSKHRNKLLIVGFLFKFQFPSVVQKVLEFFRVTLAKILYTRNSFFNFNLFILLFFSFSRKTLPWQRPPNKVHQDNPNLLEVIPPRLFNAQMSVQTCVSRSSC